MSISPNLPPKKKRGAPLGNKNAKGNPGGPPKKWKPEFPEIARRFCLLKKGATDEDLARLFDCSRITIIEWKSSHPEFADAIYQGKHLADGEVANALFQRAIGYEHEAVKIFADPKTGDSLSIPYIEHYPPDTGAAKMWLTNRSKHWKDKQTVEVEDPQGILAEMLGVKKEELP